MRMQKKEIARDSAPQSARSMPRPRAPLSLAVSKRRQTTQESHIYNSALDAVLAEWVRQHLEPKGKSS